MENASELLKHLRLVDVVETGRIVGTGAYSQVEEVRFNGLKCAGKKLRSARRSAFSLSVSPDQDPLVLSRFAEECVM